MSEWHDIETAPRDGTRILLKVRPRAHLGDDAEAVDIGYWLDNTGTPFPWAGWYPFPKPTGWMQLPPIDPAPIHPETGED